MSSEDMMRAARNMSVAAEDMKTAANWMNEASNNTKRVFDQFIQDLSSLMHRFEIVSANMQNQNVLHQRIEPLNINPNDPTCKG